MIEDNEFTRMTKANEGLRLVPYKDPTKKGNVYSIGYGHNLTAHGEPIAPITSQSAERLFSNDYNEAQNRAVQLAGNRYDDLTPTQQAILNDMSFQMGDKLGGFKNMFGAIKSGNYGNVPKEMLDSEWARQTPQRAKRLSGLWNSKL